MPLRGDALDAESVPQSPSNSVVKLSSGLHKMNLSDINPSQDPALNSSRAIAVPIYKTDDEREPQQSPTPNMSRAQKIRRLNGSTDSVAHLSSSSSAAVTQKQESPVNVEILGIIDKRTVAPPVPTLLVDYTNIPRNMWFLWKVCCKCAPKSSASNFAGAPYGGKCPVCMHEECDKCEWATTVQYPAMVNSDGTVTELAKHCEKHVWHQVTISGQ